MKPDLKIFMHWNMEGVSGLFYREQVWFWAEGMDARRAGWSGSQLRVLRRSAKRLTVATMPTAMD